MCLTPKKIYRSGNYKEDNYHGKKGDEYYIEAFTKCGHCIECVNEKSNNWVIRNKYESMNKDKICFITLTYKDSPFFLIKKHLQDFIKRLRRKLEYHNIIKKNDIKLRYFACGEYGTLHHRPHYHIIIYNWKETKENLKYMGLNKKNNVLLESKTVKDCWKFGRTVYQEFDPHEIPYIALYETPQEDFKKAYFMERQKAKEMLKDLKEKKQSNVHRKLMIATLEKTIKEQEKQKSKYIAIKEFNTWSRAIGWENFLKEYKKYNTYDFKEYIEDREFYTPSSWVKKLANNGDEQAIKEMLRRESELTSILNEQEIATKNQIKTIYAESKKVLEFAKKQEFIEL